MIYNINNEYISKPKYIEMNDKIKEILEINIEKLLHDGFIEEIILGPKCDQNINILRNFLNNNGVNNNCNITKSEFDIN